MTEKIRDDTDAEAYDAADAVSGAAAADAAASGGATADVSDQALGDEYTPTPWHFKVLLLGLVLYLLFRAIQLLIWAIEKI